MSTKKIRTNNVIGSKTLEISTMNQEIVPIPPSDWTTPVIFKSFSFMNHQDCTVILNGKSGLDDGDNAIFLKECQGLHISESDDKVHSFVIVEEGIEFNWVGKI